MTPKFNCFHRNLRHWCKNWNYPIGNIDFKWYFSSIRFVSHDILLNFERRDEIAGPWELIIKCFRGRGFFLVINNSKHHLVFYRKSNYWISTVAKSIKNHKNTVREFQSGCSTSKEVEISPCGYPRTAPDSPGGTRSPNPLSSIQENV